MGRIRSSECVRRNGGGVEERRRFLRHNVQDIPLRAVLILTGGSLLNQDLSSVIEIDARPINMSQGGICLSLVFDATWNMISTSKELEISLQNGAKSYSLKGKIVRTVQKDRLLGLEFTSPLLETSSLIN